MLVQYLGPRNSVSITCSGRRLFYFGPENKMTVEIADESAVNEILSSKIHKFKVILIEQKQPEAKPVIKEEVVEVVKKPITKKKGKKNG